MEISISSTSTLGKELLKSLRLGYSAVEINHLTSRILSINDALCYIVMGGDINLANKQIALDYLLSRLPRSNQPRQVINTLVEYADCECEDATCSGVPLTPTDQLVDDYNNQFSFLPTSCYPNLKDYEMEVEYVDSTYAPTNGLVDDVKDTYTFTPVSGLSSPTEYELEIV